MEFKTCFNESCRTKTTQQWKKGWLAKIGEFVDLCYDCGTAYEKFVYCETFHLAESGWRECRKCRKRIHCGCKASMHTYELLDIGGVCCAECAKNVQLHTSQSHRGDVELSSEKISGQVTPLTRSAGEVGKDSANANKLSKGSFGRANKSKRPGIEADCMNEPLGQLLLSTDLTTQPRAPGVIIGSTDAVKGSSASAPSQKGQNCQILANPPKGSNQINSDTTKSVDSQPRIVRPPIEGRGKTHLLPRYWPKITEQELKKLSGDLNSTVTPLFEKVLSASDAGRIGRLVLPKACAEEYLPQISQSDGVPLNIRDVQGKEWTFQFRFWPNNNSRMYVLEGVTPCIQSMQLQAGDTVIFNRMDPGGKLILDFRKASNSSDTQDFQASALPAENFPEPMDSHAVNENTGNKSNRYPRLQNLEKKRALKIGSKSRRTRRDDEDALDVRLTWEEAVDLLRPPPNFEPRIITIDGIEFEEYDEAPVFGKITIFSALTYRGHEQWAQCDDCSKWRRIPMDVLLPARWSCSDNIWDSSRSLCSAANELDRRDLDQLLKLSKDFKKRKTIDSHNSIQDTECSALMALASVAALGDSVVDSGEPSVGLTTKHPRHRSGCRCIVCSQPPSGKNWHESTCTCDVCMTVKRRFKTLHQRRKAQKQHQSKHEAKTAQAQAKNNASNDELEMNDARFAQMEPEAEVAVVKDHNDEMDGTQMTGAEGMAQAEPEGEVETVNGYNNSKDETEMNGEKGVAQAEPEAEVIVVEDHDDDKDEAKVPSFVPRQKIDLNCDPEVDDMEMELAGLRMWSGWSFHGEGGAGPSSSNWDHENGSKDGKRSS